MANTYFTNEPTRMLNQRYTPVVTGVLAELQIRSVDLGVRNLKGEFERFSSEVETALSGRLENLTEREVADVWTLYLPAPAFSIIKDASAEIRTCRKKMERMIIRHVRMIRSLDNCITEEVSKAPPAQCTRSKCKIKN